MLLSQGLLVGDHHFVTMYDEGHDRVQKELPGGAQANVGSSLRTLSWPLSYTVTRWWSPTSIDPQTNVQQAHGMAIHLQSCTTAKLACLMSACLQGTIPSILKEQASCAGVICDGRGATEPPVAVVPPVQPQWLPSGAILLSSSALTDIRA